MLEADFKIESNVLGAAGKAVEAEFTPATEEVLLTVEASAANGSQDNETGIIADSDSDTDEDEVSVRGTVSWGATLLKLCPRQMNRRMSMSPTNKASGGGAAEETFEVVSDALAFHDGIALVNNLLWYPHMTTLAICRTPGTGRQLSSPSRKGIA